MGAGTRPRRETGADRRAADRRRASCGRIRRFALGAPVFGGRTARVLRVRAVLAGSRRGRIELRRGTHVVRRVRFSGARTWRTRPAGLRRGVYGILVVSGRAHATLHVRRL